MLKIKCPECGTEIEIGKDQYNALLNDIEKEEIDKRVDSQTKQIQQRLEAELKLAKSEMEKSEQKKVADLEKEVATLTEKLKGADNAKKLAVEESNNEAQKLISEKDKEIAQLKNDVQGAEKDKQLEIDALKKNFDFELNAKEEEIKKWKEFRVGDSTKDIGESLEQYCKDLFEVNRATAYPNAYFEKDNDVIGGTKGDYVFRDFTDDDKEHEIVSIMFEMKNQKEDGDTKNESHLKKLNSDREKKNCEYAVLVSTLEPESPLYNMGIVDMSHKFPKMFVVRPQFFMAIIGLIKNMAKSRFEYKRQVIQYQKENADITNFENAVKLVAQKISDDYENASKQYDKVEKMCDDMIKKRSDLKEAFRLGKKWIGTAQNQLPELEIRKLTKNNPTMKEKFEELKKVEETDVKNAE